MNIVIIHFVQLEHVPFRRCRRPIGPTGDSVCWQLLNSLGWLKQETLRAGMRDSMRKCICSL